ncbi:MAG: IS110 family transposase [Ignavibacteria bacterium]|nr:IS110 family transposase [Ignavibacteria bacterium]
MGITLGRAAMVAVKECHMTSRKSAVGSAVTVGIDLHSTNHLVAILDAEGRPLLTQRLNNRLVETLALLNRYRERVTGIAVESTYNGYWLIDGLQDAGYRVHLAHSPAVEKQRTTKYADDETDAILLAELLREGRLPEGYLYPREERGLRDLLRRRMLLVQNQTSVLLSLQSLLLRQRSRALTGNDLKRLPEEELLRNITDPFVQHQVHALFSSLRALQQAVEQIERETLPARKVDAQFQRLLTIPGIGNVLGLIIRLEAGDMSRFKTAGDFVSYCRLAPSAHFSNGRKKGEGNRKCGNRYLAWAFLEAAQFCRRYCPEAQQYYQRKKRCGRAFSTAIASKALASKLARSAYVMLTTGQAFDAGRAFGVLRQRGEASRTRGCGVTAMV